MRRFASLTAVALAATILLAACGGSGKPSTTSASSAHDVGVKLAECMRTHGVPDFPDPSQTSGGGIEVQSNGSGADITVNGVSINGPAFQAAMKKCQSEMPQGPPISSAQLANIRSHLLKTAQCMRSHGVPNFPDPQVSLGPGGRGVQVRSGGPGAGMDPQSPAFRNAQRQCGGSRAAIALPARRAA